MRDVSDARRTPTPTTSTTPRVRPSRVGARSLGAVRDDARERIRLVDAALARLDAGTYGRCAVGGEPIPEARLAAVPWAATCVAHA